ncbi:MAG: LytTR family DNA-binding domain-containing protein [Bacteroidota bacterium]
MKLNCIIVDDEPVARDGMAENIVELDYLNLVGTAESALKAARILEKENVDLMFLDIMMPKLTGVNFLKTLKNPPLVIFTTANPDYALEGFELDVLDYLVKPISFERFVKACNKAKEFFELQNKSGKDAASEKFIFVKCSNKYEKIIFDDLLYVEAANNYVLLHTKDKRMITYLTFKGIEENLPADQFIKVHKSFIVSLSKIENLDGEEIKIGKHTVPISRNLKDEVMERVVKRKLVKR